jgi:Aspartyl protease
MMREDEIFGPEAASPIPRGRAAERQEEIPRLTEEPALRRIEQEGDTTMEDTPGMREAVKRRQRKSEVELAVDPEDFVTRAILDAKTTVTVKELLALANPVTQRIFREKITRRMVPVSGAVEETPVNHVEYDGRIGLTGVRKSPNLDASYQHDYYSKGSATTTVRIGNHTMTALFDGGSEINLMSKSTFEALGLPLDSNIDWGIKNVDTRSAQLSGVCHSVPIEVGGVVDRFHVFVTEKCAHDIILGRPWESAMRATYRNDEDGACWLGIKSKDGTKEIQILVSEPNNPRNRNTVRGPESSRTEKSYF